MLEELKHSLKETLTSLANYDSSARILALPDPKYVNEDLGLFYAMKCLKNSDSPVTISRKTENQIYYAVADSSKLNNSHYFNEFFHTITEKKLSTLFIV